jgi:hypothetical protein
MCTFRREMQANLSDLFCLYFTWVKPKKYGSVTSYVSKHFKEGFLTYLTLQYYQTLEYFVRNDSVRLMLVDETAILIEKKVVAMILSFQFNLCAFVREKERRAKDMS